MTTTHRYRTDLVLVDHALGDDARRPVHVPEEQLDRAGALVWSGSTAHGYRNCPRFHRVSAPAASAVLELSSDPAFGGDRAQFNPEQLLVAAASSCQILSFLAVAARAGIDVVQYEDDAEAEMPEAAQQMRITKIILRPEVVVAPGTDLDVVHDLLRAAHDGCFIANTLTARVELEPAVEHAPEPAA